MEHSKRFIKQKYKPVKSSFRNHSLSVVLVTLFLIFWAAQFMVGRCEYNEEREERGQTPITVNEYFCSSHFWEATGENWESEFLQMSAYVFLTIFLFQKGSSESKDPDKKSPQDKDPRSERSKPDAPWPVRRGGWILRLYENSLLIAFLLLFLASVALHAAGGVRLYNEEQMATGREMINYAEYLQTSRFWFESFQNWQSEFLAIGSMVILSIFLRQRGSPESKPVAAGMWQTGDED
ncbi:MAG: hypothetical protein QOE70_5470 [Chthoniobacter sp.]|jgi:hypothetical protein|nr:hypothetical protein [Chthoniobacter sp.]